MCKSVEVVEVIKVTSLQGKGTIEDPCIEVVQYWSKDGRLLFKENNGASSQTNINITCTKKEVDHESIARMIKNSQVLYG